MIMKVYIIEYRKFEKYTQTWISKISQEGYTLYEDARIFCQERAGNNGVTDRPFYFQINNFEEYYIHEVLIKDNR